MDTVPPKNLSLKLTNHAVVSDPLIWVVPLIVSKDVMVDVTPVIISRHL